MQLTPVKDITVECGYGDKLLKLIPGEVVAAYITIDGIIPFDAGSAKWVSLAVSLVLLVAIPLYLTKTLAVENARQVVFTMGSFLVWLYSLGGPFKLWAAATGIPFHVPYIGSILLILWTLLIPCAVSAPVSSHARAGGRAEGGVSVNHMAAGLPIERA
jgi:hypothetical protein